MPDPAIRLLLAIVYAAMLATQPPGTQPDVRRVAHGQGELEVELSIADAEAKATSDQLAKEHIVLSALWNIPGRPELKLAIITRDPAGDAYGPQLAILRPGAEKMEIVRETVRLYDDDFINPTFFRFGERVLLLADHGSEDAYGVLAFSFEGDRIRDLGELPIALPENGDVFTRGAAAAMRAEVRDGAYVLTIPGPVLFDPRGKHERTVGKRGEVVTFREIGGTFEVVPARDMRKR